MDYGILAIIAILVIYLFFFKFVYLNSSIYLQLRQKHSNSYLKKHKAQNWIDGLFYTRYCHEISKPLFATNVLYLVSAVIGVFVIVFAAVLQNENLAQTYAVYLTVLSVYAVLMWITSGFVHKVGTYESVFTKILYIGCYVITVGYWGIRAVLAVVHYFTP